MPKPISMNEEDISQFINAFEDFMKHAEENIHSHHQWIEAECYTKKFYEKKAADLNVTVDYYLEEFV